jgi:hypothetical protein
MMPNPSVELFRLINGYQMAQAIHVVASLGLADQLRDGARSVEELARLAKAHPTALYRLLRALAAAGIFHEITTGGFRSHGWAIAFVPTHRPPWGRGLSSSDVPTCGRPGVIFCKASKTGQNAFNSLHGTSAGGTAPSTRRRVQFSIEP